MYALAAQSAGTNWVVLILVYVVIFGGFYMLFMRPQKKEQKRIRRCPQRWKSVIPYLQQAVSME